MLHSWAAALRRSRRPVAALAAVVIATLALAACGGAGADQGASAASGATLRVGFISNTPTPSGPAGWADHQGTLLPGLKKAGIAKVTWIPFKNGPDLSAALQGGSVDLATLGDTPALTAKSSGLPTRLVNQENVGMDAWLFGAKGGPTTIAGLKGKTVATQVGSYMYHYLVARLKEEGIFDTVKITHVYTTDALASLQSGGIAAYAAPAGQLTDVLQKQGFPVIEKASEHPDLLGTSVTIITEDALKKYPELPAAWNATRKEAIADMTAHADEYYAFAAQATGTTPDVVKLALPVDIYRPEPFTDEGLKLLSDTNDFLVENKLEDKAVDIDAWKVPQA